MGRKSLREQRRKQIIDAFAKVLSEHGFSGATTVAVAETAGISPGLIHHHFKSKDELLDELLSTLVASFRNRVTERGVDLTDYIDGALKLDSRADTVAAKCWVSIFAEALRNPRLFARVRRLLDEEIGRIENSQGNKLNDKKASAILAYVIGSLVFGAFAPKRASGFAAECAHEILEGFGAL